MGEQSDQAKNRKVKNQKRRSRKRKAITEFVNEKRKRRTGTWPREGKLNTKKMQGKEEEEGPGRTRIVMRRIKNLQPNYCLRYLFS